ncbi:hypothetical protein CDL12_22871 [Handroanthus impetiginosus]|uniref:DUF4216 domain-containing protein n=1 Tax=Handroanthus impetiginosus TaxID=429701 RepID=A0A2G9GH22_9LAMI|nr:hypothetical protein CDL12_22871 [Handroanthus impetiginosus]
MRWVKSYKGYFVNGFKFHAVDFGRNKSTMNSGVCVFGNLWNENEVDYYDLLEEVIELEYHVIARHDEHPKFNDESAFQENQTSTIQEVPITINLDQINILLDENSVKADVDIIEIQPVEMLARKDMEENKHESDEENAQEDDKEEIFEDFSSDDDTNCEY